ncbi:unnamed protein product [Spodoptera exigua]|nr:unnamed protein product [Spodoptera exigua]
MGRLDRSDTTASQKTGSQHPEVEAATGSKASRPRRGRPSGAKHIPLTLEERRARNAQYERERREDFAAAQAELAEAAGCDPNASTISATSPNSPETELPTPSQFTHQTPSPLLQLETALEQEIALRFSQDDLLQIYGALESEDFI